MAVVCEQAGDFEATCRELAQTAFPFAAMDRDRWAARGVFFGEPAQGTSRCAFIFPGHSSQYPGMFAEAIAAIPEAAAARQQADASLKALGLQSFADVAGVNASGLGTDLWTTQAGILAGSWISYRTLTSLGLHPSITLGHSFGEYMALVAAGTWSLTDAIRAARFRTEAIESIGDVDGAMAATGANQDTLREVLGKIDGVFIANYNSPYQTVISGVRRSVLEAIEQLKAQRASAVLIKVPAPFHSPILKSAAQHLLQRLGELPIRRPEIPVISTAGLGELRSPQQIMASLSQQLVTMVDFPKMLEDLMAARPALVVEAGPKQVLTRLCQALHPDSETRFMASDHSKRKGVLGLLDVIAQADCLGCLDDQPLTEPTIVKTKTPRHAPRIVTFDATERRRQRMRSQSEKFANSPTPPTSGRVGSSSKGNGNSHESGKGYHRSGQPAAVVAAASTAATETPARFTTSPSAIATATAPPQQGLKQPQLADANATTSTSPGVDVHELRQILIDFVVEQTGYPEEMIEMDVDLEADLGIDSIKKAQLFGEVGARFSIAPREDLSLDDFSTLQHVVDFLVEEVGATDTTEQNDLRKEDQRRKLVSDVDRDDLPPAPSVPVIATAPQESNVDVDELRQILIDFVVEQTGYPEDMIEMDVDLEADLGIDSIKKAQLFGEVGSRFSIAPRDNLSLDDFPTLQHVLDFLIQELRPGVVTTTTRQAPIAESPISESKAVASPVPAEQPPLASVAPVARHGNSPTDIDVDELRQILVDFVIEQTGYPEDMIELDVDLEADLGIDSIKKAQLFGEVGSRFAIAPRDDLSLDDFSTLQHVLDFLVEELGATSAPVDVTTNAPVSAPSGLPKSRESESAATIPEFARVLSIRGNGTDRGRQLGEAFQREIQRNLMQFVGTAPGVRTDKADWSREFQEELTAIADAAFVNEEAIYAWNAVGNRRCQRVAFDELAEPCEANDGIATAIQVRQGDNESTYLTIGHAGQKSVPTVKRCVFIGPPGA
ncbi:MAG: acyltransferase domain-containing protein, partial [Planctomycetota bacterium]